MANKTHTLGTNNPKGAEVDNGRHSEKKNNPLWPFFQIGFLAMVRGDTFSRTHCVPMGPIVASATAGARQTQRRKKNQLAAFASLTIGQSTGQANRRGFFFKTLARTEGVGVSG